MEMELSEFVFRLILVFIPGLVAFIIVKQLTSHKKYEFYEETIYSFVLGWFSYFFYFGFLKVLSFLTSLKIDFCLLGVLTDKYKPLNFHEILLTSFVSIFVGLGFSF